MSGNISGATNLPVSALKTNGLTAGSVYVLTNSGSGMTVMVAPSGGGGGGSGIPTIAGVGTNTYLTNATSSGEIATNISIISGNISGATNLPPSGLSSGSASAGQVLEWSGTAWVPTSISSYLNFTTVGGVNDGVTLNDAAFSNACAALGPAGGVLYMPKGSGYKFKGGIIITNQQITIQGDGMGVDGGLGEPDVFSSVIIWTNLTTNLFTFTGQSITFQNLSGFWTNTAAPTAGAFIAVTTNWDGVNGQVQCNWLNVLLDGGYRCVDYQAGQNWQATQLEWVRWWMDGIRINNLANPDIGGWTITGSGWAAVAGLQYTIGAHVANSAICWNGSGGGSIINTGGGAFNWGGYSDPGGYTNAILIQPEYPSGADSTSTFFINNALIDNYLVHGIYSEPGTGSFSNIKFVQVQMESFVGGASSAILLTGGIGNNGTIDGFSTEQPIANQITLSGMAGIGLGLINNSGVEPSVELLSASTCYPFSDFTGIFDPFAGNPQLKIGSWFLQSLNTNDTTLGFNGYFTGSGLTAKQTGAVATIQGLNQGGMFMTLYGQTTAGAVVGSPTQIFAVRPGGIGIGTFTPAAELTVNGAAIVSNSVTANGGFIGLGSALTNSAGHNYQDGVQATNMFATLAATQPTNLTLTQIASQTSTAINGAGITNIPLSGAVAGGNTIATNGQATATNNIGFVLRAEALTLNTSANYFAPSYNSTGGTEVNKASGLLGGVYGDNVTVNFSATNLPGTNVYIIWRTNQISCATNVISGPITPLQPYTFSNPLTVTNGTTWDFIITNSVSTTGYYITMAVSQRPL